MKREIERKFLVKKEFLPKDLETKKRVFLIRQGYLSHEPVVRIRLLKSLAFGTENFHDFATGYLTIKGPGLINHSEFETIIPYPDAKEMYETLAKGKISKRRYIIPDLSDKNLNWEVDFFEDKNEGLVIAEIELPKEDYEFSKPEWLGEEITHISLFSNSNLSKSPFELWSSQLEQILEEYA